MNGKPKVLITNRIPEEGMHIAEEHCEVKVFDYEGALQERCFKEVKG